MSAPVGCGMSLVKRGEDPIRRDPARAHGHTSRFVLGLGGQGSVPAGATRRPPANSSPRPPDGPDHVDWGPSERLSSKRAPTGMADEDEQGEHRMPAGSRACGLVPKWRQWRFGHGSPGSAGAPVSGARPGVQARARGSAPTTRRPAPSPRRRSGQWRVLSCGSGPVNPKDDLARYGTGQRMGI